MNTVFTCERCRCTGDLYQHYLTQRWLCWTCLPEDNLSKQTQREPELPQMLPVDSAERKNAPIYSGVVAYFPLALAAIARLSKKGNDKHNPGEPMHHARSKGGNDLDCVMNHAIDAGTIDPDTGELHDTALAWRALSNLEKAEEKRLGKPLPRGAKP